MSDEPKPATCPSCMGPGRILDSGNEFKPHPSCPRCKGTGAPQPDIAALVAKLRRLDAARTQGILHYYPCGEKSNDCLIGFAWDNKQQQPPGGEVNLSPYNERTRKYEEDKYILDPIVAASEDHANYADFAYLVAAANAIPALCQAWEEATAREQQLADMVERQVCINIEADKRLAAAEQRVADMSGYERIVAASADLLAKRLHRWITRGHRRRPGEGVKGGDV